MVQNEFIENHRTFGEHLEDIGVAFQFQSETYTEKIPRPLAAPLQR